MPEPVPLGSASTAATGERSTRALPTAVWIAQAVLAGVLGAAGALELSMPLPELAKTFAWTTSVPPSVLRSVVTLAAVGQVVAAVAVLLPPWNPLAADLSRIAAWAVAVAMTFETALRLGSGDLLASCASSVLWGVAAIVAWGRGDRRTNPASDHRDHVSHDHRVSGSRTPPARESDSAAG